MSPSIMVHRGPARMRLRSSTRTPASAPLAEAVIGSGLFPAHRRRRIEVFGATVEIVFELALVAHAEFLEVGFAAFKEGGHAFETFLRAPDMGQQFHAV